MIKTIHLIALMLSTKINLAAPPNCASTASCCSAVKYIWKHGGFLGKDLNVMTAVTFFESTWGAFRGPKRNVNGSYDYGLFQINSYLHCSKDGTNKDCCCPGTIKTCGSNAKQRTCSCTCGVSCDSLLLDDSLNAKCAATIFKQSGNKYTPWNGYNSHVSESDAFQIFNGTCDTQNGCCNVLFPGSTCCQARLSSYDCCPVNYSKCCPNGSQCCPSLAPVCCPTGCCLAGFNCCGNLCCKPLFGLWLRPITSPQLGIKPTLKVRELILKKAV